MKKSLISLILLLFFHFAISQSSLQIHSNEKGLYLQHTVAPKETLYSLSRTFSIAPKEIATYNQLDLNSGLLVGQMIYIPLTSSNFSQAHANGTPVYYTVGEKEGLYRVSLKNGNVLMADLRKWNKLSSDAIHVGQKLIVGYLATQDVAVEKTVKFEGDAGVQRDVRIEPRATEPVRTADAPVKRTVVTTPAPTAARTAVNDGNGGYFKSQFEQQSRAGYAGKELAGTSGIFKTASGWKDAKYYALVDGVDPGTIIRVTNPGNGRSIYAKVLGGMSGIRQNQGFDLRISNAAASVLEIADAERFSVKLSY